MCEINYGYITFALSYWSVYRPVLLYFKQHLVFSYFRVHHGRLKDSYIRGQRGGRGQDTEGGRQTQMTVSQNLNSY